MLLYVENDQWELMRPVTLTKEPFVAGQFLHDLDTLVVTIRIKRRSLYYLFILICPNLLIYYLSTLVFLLPIESGEKVSFIVTLLLAEVVTVGTLNDIFPASSLGFPIMAGFATSVVLHLSALCVASAAGEFIRLKSHVFITLLTMAKSSFCKLDPTIATLVLI